MKNGDSAAPTACSPMKNEWEIIIMKKKKKTRTKMSNEVIILNGYKIVRFLNLLAECGNVLVGSLKISLGDIKLFIRYNTHLS